MNEKTKSSGAILLADMIQYPNRNRSDHSHTDDQPREHGLKEANKRFNVFMSAGLLRDRYPNFMEIGFKAQAFIDITLSKSAEESTNIQDEAEVRKKLNAIPNVILVYTVFGSVDVRCKVVGIDLRDVERTTMLIREIKGVLDTSTSVIIDDTNYNLSREKWAELIKHHSQQIEPTLPTKYEDTEAHPEDDQGST
ncbi:Lrp/AsnC ligand binding domain-containing protein [Gymnodinialimonas sp. 2305UL16-5]|uniref:Lrp/AsnC family transcriptional regulator n=1 Tax=Gymnodinialimonas mytili TaxID=3126503 RepID=UPI0030A2876F